MQVKPRIYQELAINSAVNGLREELRALVVLATGLGKTLTSAFIAEEFRAKRILFLVHNNFILKHAAEEYSLIFSDAEYKKVVYNGFSKKGVHDADIVFATWQTMSSNLNKWRADHFDLVIVDEAHHTAADTYRPVVDYFTAPKLGITATPDRLDDADIREVFGHEVIDISLEEAIARGWLPKIEYHVMLDESLDDKVLQEIAKEIREGKKRFTMAEVNRRLFIRKRDEEIARIINSCNEKAVVFCASIPHAERMVEVLDSADSFHSKKERRQKDAWEKNQATLKALKSGEIQRVCTVNAFNEGVNVPSIGLVVFCRATESYAIFKQQLGRGAHSSSDRFIVYDFVGNLERIQIIMEMVKKVSDLHEKYTSESERKEEGYVRESFEVSGKGFEFTFSDKIVDMIDVLNHCKSQFYETWQEASEAAIELGIKSSIEYRIRYKEDPRLPGELRFYNDFPGFSKFISRFYPTWKEASEVSRKLGLKTVKDYKKKCKRCDPKLPYEPEKYYKDFPGFAVFFNKEFNPYPTWQEASHAVQRLKIKSLKEYYQRYKEDRRLPCSPDTFYANYPGFKKFLGKE